MARGQLPAGCVGRRRRRGEGHRPFRHPPSEDARRKVRLGVHFEREQRLLGRAVERAFELCYEP